MTQKLRCITLALLVVAAAFMAPAHANEREIRELASVMTVEIKRQYGTSDQIDTLLGRMFGELPPDKLEVARPFLRAMLMHEALPEFVARLVAPLYRPGIAAKDLQGPVTEGMVSMQLKGLARLPTERQADFLRHTVNMSRMMSPAQCKALYLGQMSTEESIVVERAQMARLPLHRFQDVINMYRESMVAELTGYPDAKLISREQALAAEQVFDTVAGKRLIAQIPVATLVSIDKDVNGTSPEEVCLYMSTYLESMLDLTEPYRGWKLGRFIQSLN